MRSVFCSLFLAVLLALLCGSTQAMSKLHLADSSGVFHAKNPNQIAVNGRPVPSERKFVSPFIDQLIVKITAQMSNPGLAALFNNCLPNTLDTTVMNFTAAGADGLPDTFLVTGDITAMWLRDSTNQVLPYVPYAAQDAHLQTMLLGVIFRQAKSILIDSYANAFNFGPTGSPWQSDKRTPAMTPSLWEGKYELDSLCAHMWLSYKYWNATKDATPFKNAIWQQAMEKIVQTITVQQKGTWEDMTPEYFFQRETAAPTDTLMHGVGVPANRTGMSKSPFRPSDDASTLPFPIAANALAVVCLRQIAALFGQSGPAANETFASQITSLADTIQKAIADHGTFNHPVYGKVYAFEVDGYGNYYGMDDANIPSLLSLPHLGWCPKDDPLYLNTRKFLLSNANPYYASGSAGSGIGGPHIGPGWIWPMSIIMQAQTSTSDAEIVQCLDMLNSTSAGTGFMHESFWVNDATEYTRPWFAWANAQFGHLILTLAAERPHLIFKN